MKVNNIEESNFKALLEIEYIVNSCLYTEHKKLEKITEALKVNKSEKEMFDKEREKRHKEVLSKMPVPEDKEQASWSVKTDKTIII